MATGLNYNLSCFFGIYIICDVLYAIDIPFSRYVGVGPFFLVMTFITKQGDLRSYLLRNSSIQ